MLSSKLISNYSWMVFFRLKATNAICGLLLILNVLSFTLIGRKDLVAKFYFHDVCANLVILL